MDDALRKRLDAIVILLVVISVLLALILVGLGGGELLVLALLGGFVSVTVAYAILVGTKPTETADET